MLRSLNVVKSALVASVAMAIVGPALSASPSGGAAQSATELAFAFVVGRHEAGTVLDARPDVKDASATDFTDGETMDAAAVLRGLTARSQEKRPGAGSAFINAELIAHLENVSAGGVSEEVIALCPTLDFEHNEGDPFEVEVSCGDRTIAYTVTAEGIAITTDGEVAYSYDLSPGAYMLNGVPFLVN